MKRISNEVIAARWKQRISTLPPRMAITQAADYLGVKFGAMRYWLKKVGYDYSDGRTYSWPESRRLKRRQFDPKTVDWRKPNVLIARETGVSRERIRQVREDLNLKKVNGRK